MRFRLLGALRQRDFAFLFVGQTISLIGDGVFGVALAWQALEMSSSPTTLGLVLLVRSAARVLILLLGGAMADRFDRRYMLLGGDVVQAVAVGAVAIVAATGELQVWQLLVAAVATGIGSGIFIASATAVVPQLVDEEHLASANSLASTSRLLADDLLGPALGGIIVAAAGTAAAFSINAISFVASIAALLVIRPRPYERDDSESLLAGVKQGVAYVRGEPWIWISLLAVGAVGNFVAFGPLPVLVPLLVREDLGAGADALGLVFAGFGVGGVLAAIVIGNLVVTRRNARIAYAGWAAGGLALAALALAPNVGVACGLLAVAGFTGEAANLIWVTLLQKYVPERLLGRVSSIDWLVSLSLQPAGLAAAGPAAAVLGAGGALAVGGIAGASAVTLGATTPQIRRFSR